MHELNDNEVDAITAHVVSHIHIEQLQSELIDHCCCAVEELMTEGSDFENALDQAFKRLHPGNIHEIEVEVQFVLIPKTIQIMKAILFFSGFLAAFCIMTGIMFKSMSWPGANILLVCGSISLCTSMLVMLATLFRTYNLLSRLSVFRILTAATGGLLIGAGSVLKVLQMPYGAKMLVSGIAIVTLLFLPLFFWQLYQKEMRTA